jgi:hypothetical protein
MGLSYFPVSQGYTNPTGQNLPQLFGIPARPVLPSFLQGLWHVTIGNNLAQFNTFADTVIQAGDPHQRPITTTSFIWFQFNRYRDNSLTPATKGWQVSSISTAIHLRC